MNYSPLFGLVIWGIMIVASVQISRKAIRSLSQEEKVKLVEVAGTRKGYGILVVLALVAGWYVIIQKYPSQRLTAHILLMALLLGFAVSAVAGAHRRMNRLGLPQKFQRSMLIASVLRVGALFVLAISVLWPILWQPEYS
jgi:hypothetical protein